MKHLKQWLPANFKRFGSAGDRVKKLVVLPRSKELARGSLRAAGVPATPPAGSCRRSRRTFREGTLRLSRLEGPPPQGARGDPRGALGRYATWSSMNELTSSESVVIAVVPRDRFSMFPRCLEALYAHTDVRFRVIVVAGGTDRTTEEYLHQLQMQKDNMSVVLVDRLLMQGEARRVAIRQADERFCVVLENDTIVHENWLSSMLECMREEGAAVVTPLILWHRGIHAAGCMFEEREKDGAVAFHHKIMYTGIRRRRIDYPENHCILIDQRLLPGIDIFDDVEPFDVDLGLTLRKYGLSVFLEPRSVATYSAPPPWEVRDIPAFKFRWDAASWEARNRRFMQKWGVTYDPSSKRASYRRQQFKLGLARWYPTKFTVGVSNVAVSSVRRLLSLVLPGRPPYSLG